MVSWGRNVSLVSRRANDEHNECCAGMGLMRRRHSTPDVRQDYIGKGWLFWLKEKYMTWVLLLI